VKWTWLPWARWNLRRNPFGELIADERAELAVLPPGQQTYDVFEQGHALQLIGESGRGKTTRMLVLWRNLPSASYVYLPEGGPTPPIPAGNPLLIDEAQRLTRKLQASIFCLRLPLVLATHADLTRPLQKWGYVVRTINIERDNTPELIHAALNRRIEASRLEPGELPEISFDEARKLAIRFGSDLRAIEHFLYERLQDQVHQDGEVQFVD
jgi:hypothetical protein